jgi:hypothetical protein
MALSQKAKLIISILVDIFGYSSYLIPFFGELTDIGYAFIEAAWIWFSYKTAVGAAFGGLEEILPYTDFIPTCTIVHFIMKSKEKKKENSSKISSSDKLKNGDK